MMRAVASAILVLVNIVVTPELLAPLHLEIAGWRTGAIKLLFRKLNSTSCEQRRRAQPLIDVAKMPAGLEELRAPLIVVAESRDRRAAAGRFQLRR